MNNTLTFFQNFRHGNRINPSNITVQLEASKPYTLTTFVRNDTKLHKHFLGYNLVVGLASLGGVFLFNCMKDDHVGLLIFDRKVLIGKS